MIEALLRPLDRIRWHFIVATGALGRRLIVDRSERVAVLGAATLVVLLALAGTIPLWLLALGPIVWGVPHVMADIRYLVVRPGYHRRTMMAIATLVPLAATAITADVLWGVFACVVAAACSRATAARRVGVLFALCVLLAALYVAGPVRNLYFAYAHNFIAVLLWYMWRPRNRHTNLVALLFLVASAAIMWGIPFSAIEASYASTPSQQMNIDYFAWSLAPNVKYTSALRLLTLFAFTQAVHYAIWLRLVPEDDRPQRTTRTFVKSWRALRDDLGLWVLAVTALAALIVAVWACVDLAQARAGYLRAAVSHGSIELVALALIACEGTPKRRVADT